MRCLTFELSGRRRQDAKPGPVKMYRVPPARAWWPAVGAPLERGVRPHCACGESELHSQPLDIPTAIARVIKVAAVRNTRATVLPLPCTICRANSFTTAQFFAKCFIGSIGSGDFDWSTVCFPPVLGDKLKFYEAPFCVGVHKPVDNAWVSLIPWPSDKHLGLETALCG